MITATASGKMQQTLAIVRMRSGTIGFVPTMGALHKGHLSLIAQARAQTDFVVCSIFVNPTQFNEKSDYTLYPRTEKEDAALLEEAGCDLLFLPKEKAIYPLGSDSIAAQVELDLKGLDTVMEGQHRPGHFKGVVQVVNRLLALVQPDKLFMGQKDYQQFSIIRRLIEEHQIDTQLIMCPTVREADGLAMSSRNRRLTDEQRKQSVALSEALQMVVTAGRKKEKPPLQEVLNKATKHIKNAGLEVEYLNIADQKTLATQTKWQPKQKVVVATAAKVGTDAQSIRLIDNMLFQVA